MTTTTENNKKIAKNTLFLYFRQILIMVVSLYTVRVVLAALGEEDYGIYNVVGGFVAMFNILSGALSVAISRFITYEMGQRDFNTLKLQRIFSTSIIIQVMMGVIIALLIATFGVWFVTHKMVIPAGRMDITLYVLLCSTITFFINLLSVPYNALIIAHEQMKAFAYISILEVAMKLLVAYLLLVVSMDKLLLYACCMVLVSLTIRSVYAIYCKRHFAECHFIWGFDRQLLSKMFVFSGWAFMGSGAVVMKDQGTGILLNLFGGSVVNAAQGIAMQVNAAVYSFVSNFMLASNPQITMNFSSGKLEAMHSLILRTAKFGFFILLLMLFPLCSNIDYLLGLWLVQVPEHTTHFVILVLLYSLIECFVGPLVTGVLAHGNIKRYEIILTGLYFTNIVASYLCLKVGMPVESVFVMNIIFKALVLIALLQHAKVKFAFPVYRFLKETLLPAMLVFVVSGSFAYWISQNEMQYFLQFIVRSLLIVLFTSISIYALGLKHEERLYFKNLIKNKIGYK